MTLAPFVDEGLDNPPHPTTAHPLENGMSVWADAKVRVQVVGERIVRPRNFQAGDGVGVALSGH